MSYDIYFINKKDLELEEVEELLESDPESTDDIYISKDLINSIKSKIEALDFEFEIEEDEDFMEINFPSFQILCNNAHIVFTIPYWEENKTDTFGKTIQKLAKVLEKEGFTGYDPQGECLYDDDFDFSDAFSITQDYLMSKMQSVAPQKKWWQFWK